MRQGLGVRAFYLESGSDWATLMQVTTRPMSPIAMGTYNSFTVDLQSTLVGLVWGWRPPGV